MCVDRIIGSCRILTMNTEQVLIRLNIDSECRLRAVQDVRQLIEGSTNPLAAAKVLFSNLAPPDSEFKFTDANDARLIVAKLVESAIMLGEKYDPQDALVRAATWLVNHKTNNPWSFLKTDSGVSSETQHREGVNIEVKADGSFKKGSKQILAKALFDSNPTLNNAELINLFVKELDMSVAGARTYVYNCRKAVLVGK